MIELVRQIQQNYTDHKTAENERQGKPPPKSGRFTVPGRKYRELRVNPLLIVHLLTILKPFKEGEEKAPSVDGGVIGWSISFPETEYEEETVEYVVNTTWWKDTYGDDFDEEEAEDD